VERVVGSASERAYIENSTVLQFQKPHIARLQSRCFLKRVYLTHAFKKAKNTNKCSHRDDDFVDFCPFWRKGTLL
jgi:hypothetical protein